jgi:hypothetical protein
MAPRLRSAVVRFDALPEAVLRVLFLALPVDTRARAACVCRSWRAFLSDASLWQVLELGYFCRVAPARVTENLVRGGSRCWPACVPSAMDIAARLRVHSAPHLARHAGNALTRHRCVRSARPVREPQAHS